MLNIHIEKIFSDKLTEKGYTEQQINELKSVLDETNIKYFKDFEPLKNSENYVINENSKKEVKDESDNTLLILTTLVQSINPEIIKSFKKGKEEYYYQFGIALLVVGALLTLSILGILGSCETGTILGGIVGYLLGKEK
jgi:hypothetical protein